MAVLMGIDEAGYGPVLGPLAVSSATFMLPDELLRSDMWLLMPDSVAKEKRNLKGRLLITDSKKAYNRKSGLAHLERTSLAMLGAMDLKPANLAELLGCLSPETVGRLSRYPWYRDLDKITISRGKADFSIAGGVFERECEKKGISILSLRSELIDAGYYNELVSKVNNKASVLFTSVCRHIDWAFRHFGQKNLQIIVDRQGGRSRYMPVLSKMFPDAQGRIIREDDTDCSYELIDGSRKMRIHFLAKADGKCLPVSLASMVSKYLRELMVCRINDYFIKRLPSLKPTAGYWSDGNRFIADIEKSKSDIIQDKNLLIRVK